MLDVAEDGYDALHRAISETCSYYKRGVACMVNNAGVMSLGDIATQLSSEWEKMFKINSVSIFVMIVDDVIYFVHDVLYD